MPKARAAALRALQIDDSLAEAHTSLALIAENYDYDWQTAEKEYRRAIQLDPQDATGHQWFAECLSLQGRFTEALTESERARQLDPLSLIIGTDHGVILYFARQYDRAIEQFQAVLAMEPNFMRAHAAAWAYVEEGRFAEALQETRKWQRSDGTPLWEGLAYVYARAGQQTQARRAMARWEQLNRNHVLPVTTTVIGAYIAMNDQERALVLLEKSYAERSILPTSLKVDPEFDPLRNDPRFQTVLRKVGLAN